ncbi:MFS transporter [Streptomyces halstedii]|uniref:MFS transporter n=1 Tax=Streptomyces halstedii TaxID=1944 RepID=UPI003F4E3132
MMIYYTPVMLTDAGFPSTFSLQANVYVGVVYVVMTLVGKLLVDHIGRRRLMLTMLPGSAVSIALFGLLFIVSDNQPNRWLALAMLLAFMFFQTGGMQVVGWLTGSEVYPLRIRPAATGLHAGTVGIEPPRHLHRADPGRHAHPGRGDARVRHAERPRMGRGLLTRAGDQGAIAGGHRAESEARHLLAQAGGQEAMRSTDPPGRRQASGLDRRWGGRQGKRVEGPRGRRSRRARRSTVGREDEPVSVCTARDCRRSPFVQGPSTSDADGLFYAG